MPVPWVCFVLLWVLPFFHELSLFSCELSLFCCMKQHESAFTWQTKVGKLMLSFFKHVWSHNTPIWKLAAVGQWHLQRVPACPLVLFYVYHRKMNRREHCRNIKIWTKPYLSRSPSLAVYNMLIQELYAEDVAGFKNCLHMDQTCFNELSQIIK